jgi:DNA-binding transcriptional LysR family regulator
VQQLLAFGGSGYFPRRLEQHRLESGQLWQVPDSPRFKVPVWMIYPRRHDSDSLTQALGGLRALARDERSRSAR